MFVEEALFFLERCFGDGFCLLELAQECVFCGQRICVSGQHLVEVFEGAGEAGRFECAAIGFEVLGGGVDGMGRSV